MSEQPQITETPVTPPKKPRKQRRTRRIKARAPRSAAPPTVAPATAGDLAGISPTECCDTCYETGKCCISGDICVHPFKGGLQSAHMMKPEIVRKFARAKRLLRNMKIELRE